MENLNFHKQKLYSLIIAGVALVACILPWMTAKGGYGISLNGFKSWGLVSVIGIIGVIAACFMGDKTKAFEGQTRQIALGAFGAIGLGALLYMLRIMTASTRGVKISNYYSPGFGLFICLIAGAVGLLFVMGKIKFPDPKPKA